VLNGEDQASDQPAEGMPAPGRRVAPDPIIELPAKRRHEPAEGLDLDDLETRAFEQVAGAVSLGALFPVLQGRRPGSPAAEQLAAVAQTVAYTKA
jgi:hypothetical protein